LKAGNRILVSSAETRRAFNLGSDTVNLHRHTEPMGLLDVLRATSATSVLNPRFLS